MRKIIYAAIIIMLSLCLYSCGNEDGETGKNVAVPDDREKEAIIIPEAEASGENAEVFSGASGKISEETDEEATRVTPDESSEEASEESPEEISAEASSKSPEEISAETSADDQDEAPAEAAPEGSAGEPDDEIIEEAGGFTESPITDEIRKRIDGLSYKENCTVPYEDLRYLRVLYVDFNGNTQTGEIICNKAISRDLLDIFRELYETGYQIDKIRLVDEYGADDDLSCADDNTSCFNFRTVEGSANLSKHALGLAVDINPFYNPYVTYPQGSIRISPPGSEKYADRNADFPHKIDKNDPAYKAFVSRGFKWGGSWKTLKDYQHFQKG